MSKYRSALIVIGKATGFSLLLYLLLQMLIGVLAVRGTLPESRLLAAQTGAIVLALFPGGVYAARKAGLGALPSALLTALCLCAALAVLGVLIFGGVSCTMETGVLLLGAAGGGILAGVAGGTGKKRGRKRRVAVRR